MNDTVILHADATPCAPALVLRPWCARDAAALVAVARDPALRRWTSLAVEDEADALRWVRGQERGWAAGDRFSFAVVEKQPGSSDGPLMGHVVLKEVVFGQPSAEVGYWTAAHARGRGVAPRALSTLTTWAFDRPGAGLLKHLELRHQVGNAASCRVAHKSGYLLEAVLPATPPAYPGKGHRHIRRRDT
ncbi:GNAT family N-acetyltransferase [Streptomyces sp. IBSBF 3136]|uniref:GNAT family N-acetyltransferase n=1 Tax=Streptomyces sp. IBSBF 3136 TaxID=2903524 RepID=UPI002FDC6F5A